MQQSLKEIVLILNLCSIIFIYLNKIFFQTFLRNFKYTVPDIVHLERACETLYIY